ncbi:MAG: TIR domain-containing protein [Cyanobacteria bacterium P01_F01_bin.150]
MPQSSYQPSELVQSHEKQFKDAFISYGRADSKAFAAKLSKRLIAQGLKVWFDFEDIPLGVDYQKQIDSGIDHSDNFLFLISPHSVNSPYCQLEIERALHYRKRIIPLLHVEEISREVWQQRNPTGTDAEWATYQSEGKHSSFPNMNKAIAKINWVYFREGQDDVEPAFQGLLDIVQRQREYVHHHTVFLTQAQTWERHQRRSQYLLIGEERQQAEAWLTTRFRTEQPPCMPTVLQAEFITESTKNANNMMTQVFLAHAENDRDLRDRFRERLMQENITVWTNKSDIPTGADFKRAIQHGIEEADNVVYLLSPHALASKMCQMEILYAQKLNKRIIPLLVTTVDPQQIPQHQLSLQFIDFSSNTTAEQYDNDVAKLLRILQQDADYYSESKQLLVKAFKWQRQNRNPSILLRGYNLRHAEAWLKVAKVHAYHRPLALQTEFIAESLRQPPAQSLDVFISYSRSDSEFARRINDALQIQGKTTWFDQESIASGADFQQEIYRGIEASSNFLFILSPRSVRSPYCDDEVSYAAGLNKRFVPLLYHPVETQDVPAALAAVQWIDFTDREQDFLNFFSQLVRTLDTDRDHVNSHTKWSQLAIAWTQKARSPDLLLRGSELAIAQTWLQAALADDKQPRATDLQQAFIAASRSAEDAETKREQQRQAHLLKLQQEKTQEAEARLFEQKRYSKRQRRDLGIVSVALVLATGLGVLAFGLYDRANKSAREAKESEQEAIYKQVEADSKEAEALFASNYQLEALAEALEAGNTLRAATSETDDHQQDKERPVIRALGSVLYGIRERNRFSNHTNLVTALSFSPEGDRIASASWDNTIRIWQAQTGELIHTLTGEDGHQGPVYDVAFSPDGQLIASASEDNTVKVWRSNGELVHTLKSHDKTVQTVVFTPDGQTIISGGDDGTIKFWRRDGSLLGAVEAHRGETVYDLAISPDGQILASGGSDRTIELRNLSGKLLTALSGHTEGVHAVAFSPDGSTIASASKDQTLRLWGADGLFKRELKGHRDWVEDVSFSPNGQHLASASRDRTVRLWQADNGIPMQTIEGHENEVWAVAFNHQRNQEHAIASAGADNTVRLWALQEELLQVFDDRNHSSVNGVSVSPDGQLMATVGGEERTPEQRSGNDVVNLWKRPEADDAPQQPKPIQSLTGHTGRIHSVGFSPDGLTLASTGEDNTAKIWASDGTLLHTLTGHTDQVYDAAFSPDGQTLATASKDRTVKIWDVNSGNLRQTLTGHNERVYAVSFSPDGSWLASTGQDGTIRLWQRQANGTFIWDQTRAFELDDNLRTWYRDVTFSPDGQTLATASYDKKVRLWTVDGELSQTFTGHGAWVSSVAFNQDNDLLVSGSGDKTIKLWQLNGTSNNPLLLTLASHNDWIMDVAFYPNQDSSVPEQIMSGSADGIAIVWTLERDLPSLMKGGCDWAKTYLENNSEVAEGDRTLCTDIKP